MRVMAPPEPSIVQSAFAAPLIAPILAIPLVLVSFSSSGSADAFNIVLALPFIVVLSLFFGYLGMLTICLPILALLNYFKKLNAVRLCFYTTAVGASAWAWLFHFGQLSDFPAMAQSFFVGAGCSLGVSAFFCVLAGIKVRSIRRLDEPN
jgi:hypothetical protein